MPRKRLILRRIRDEAMSSQDLADRMAKHRAIAILDKSEHMLLVEGEDDALARACNAVEGWTALPVTTIKRPDTRPRVLKRPA